MADNMLSNRPVYGRTFHTAMWTIGLVAAAQLLSVIRVVMSRSHALDAPAMVDTVALPPVQEPSHSPLRFRFGNPESSAPPAADVTMPPKFPDSAMVGGNPANTLPLDPIADEGLAIQESFNEGAGTVDPARPADDFSGNPLPEPTFVGPGGTGDGSLSEALAAAAMNSPEIEDPILEGLVSAGQELRTAGNMGLALQNLRKAEAALPNHPRVLAELAATFSQMGLDSKADVYWESIRDLGPSEAGAYYDLADRELRGEQAPVVESKGSLLGIRTVDVQAHPPGEDGQRVTLRIAIDGDPKSELQGDQMSLLVFFYDQVDGEKIMKSTADTFDRFLSAPYDWAEGVEEIEVDYLQPVFTEEQLKELGRREYYGYVMEVYYQDELQDRIGKPEGLQQIRDAEGAQEGEYIEEESAMPEADTGLFPEASLPTAPN